MARPPPPVVVGAGSAGQETCMVPDVLKLLSEQLDAQERVLKAQMESVEKSRAVLEAVQMRNTPVPNVVAEESPVTEFSPRENPIPSEPPVVKPEAAWPVDSGPGSIAKAPHERGPEFVTRLYLFRRIFNVLQYLCFHLAYPRSFEPLLYGCSDRALLDNLEYFFDSRLLYHMLFSTISLPALLEIEKPVTNVDVVFFELMTWAALTNFMSIAFLNFSQTSFKRVHLHNLRPWAAANRHIFQFQGIVDMMNTWALNLAMLWYTVSTQVEHLLPSGMLAPADLSLRAGLGLGRLAIFVALVVYCMTLVNIASVTTEYSGAMLCLPLPRDDSSVEATASMFGAACVGGLDQGRDAVMQYMLQHRQASEQATSEDQGRKKAGGLKQKARGGIAGLF